MILLLFIAMIPVSTAMYAQNRDLWPAALFVNANLFIVFLTLYLMWIYVAKHRELLDPELTAEHIAFTLRPSMLLIPVISITAITLSVIAPAWSTVPYVLAPFIMTRRHKGLAD
jgi:uncharacterized membrane protein